MTRRYETVYIFDSTLEETAVAEKLDKFHAMLTRDGKGSVTDLNHWGKRTLAYPLKSKEAGYYVVARFEAERDVLPEYERLVKLDEGVLRYLTVQAGVEPVAPAGPSGGSDDEETEDEE